MSHFFVPFAEDDAQAERVYSGIREFMRQVAFAPTDRRIFQLHDTHNGKKYVSTVGREEPEGETVIAILEALNPTPVYMICTPNRGVVRGEPILAGNVQQVVDFEPAGFPQRSDQDDT